MGCVAASQAKNNLIKLPSMTSSCTMKSASEPAIMLQTRQISMDALRGQTAPNVGRPLLEANDVYEDNDADNAEMENQIHRELTRGEIEMDVHETGAFEISYDLQRKLSQGLKHKHGLRTTTSGGQYRYSHTTDDDDNDDGSPGSPDCVDLDLRGLGMGKTGDDSDDDSDHLIIRDAGPPRDLIRSLSAKRLERYCLTAEYAAKSSMKSPINDDQPVREFPKEDHGAPHEGEAREENGKKVGASILIKERSKTIFRGQVLPNAPSSTGG